MPATWSRTAGQCSLLALALTGALSAGAGAQTTAGVQTPAVYQPADMQADLLRFRNALTIAHPGLYTHESAAELDAFFATLMSEISLPRTAIDFHLVVMRLVARLHDGHARAFTTNATQRFINSQGLLPFHVTIQNERIFVRRDMSDAQLGAGSEILSIDGVPSNVVLRRMQPCFGVDGGTLSALYYRLGSNYNSFYRVFPLVFGFQPRYDLAVRDAGSGRIRDVTVNVLSGGTFTRIERERYGDLLHLQSLEADLARPALELRVEPLAGYALLTIRRFVKDGYDEPADAFSLLYRDAFRRIAQAKVGTLIIDLRANGGGIGANAARLVSYLSDSTFIPTKTMTFRGDDAYYAAVTSDSLRLNEYFGLRRSGAGMVVTRADRIVELQRFTPVADDRFRGRLIVLIDGGTLSAAGMAAGLLQQFTNATFVGQEAGGYAGMSNGVRQLSVRGLRTDSGINFPLAHSEFTVSPHRRTRGAVPDHVVFESVDDIRRGRDAILEFALAMLK